MQILLFPLISQFLFFSTMFTAIILSIMINKFSVVKLIAALFFLFDDLIGLLFFKPIVIEFITEKKGQLSCLDPLMERGDLFTLLILVFSPLMLFMTILVLETVFGNENTIRVFCNLLEVVSNVDSFYKTLLGVGFNSSVARLMSGTIYSVGIMISLTIIGQLCTLLLDLVLNDGKRAMISDLIFDNETSEGNVHQVSLNQNKYARGSIGAAEQMIRALFSIDRSYPKNENTTSEIENPYSFNKSES